MSAQPISRCLIADDNAVDLKHGRRIFAKMCPEAQIFEATSVEEAVKVFLEEDLDLALLDNDLGDGTSVQTIPAMLQLFDVPVPPMIMISGNEDPGLLSTARHLGFDGFIQKGSFDSDELAKALEALKAA